jgi:hypothetical protein
LPCQLVRAGFQLWNPLIFPALYSLYSGEGVWICYPA